MSETKVTFKDKNNVLKSDGGKNIGEKNTEEIRKRINTKIDAIKRYYEISTMASTYIFFRRKRSYPWKKKSDPKYLFWNAKLQNALIFADSIFGFDWESMEYGKEEETLAEYGIDIKAQSNDLYRKKERSDLYIDEEGNEWNIVSSKKKHNDPDEVILRSLGLLPK